MKIELTNVHFAAFASEETNCFDAIVWADGKRIGRVSNEGRGGPNMWDNWKARETIDAYAKTLPMVVTDMDDPQDKTKKFTYAQDADHLVDEEFSKWLADRDAKKERAKFERDMKVKIFFTKPGQKGVWTTKKVSPEQLAKYLQAADETKRVLKAETVLNYLPINQAFDLWNANVERA